MTAIAIGKFDALHLGHRALAQRAGLLVRLTGMARVFGWPERPPLVAPVDRVRVLADWWMQEREQDIGAIRDLDADGVMAWLGRLGASRLIVGHDFRCGRDRSVDAAALRARGLPVDEVDAVQVGGAPASSSRIRAALERGDLAEAEACLGRPHRLCGTVRRGDGRGRTLGFPTCNLGACDNLVPRPGVYAARAVLAGDIVPAAVNIGRLPTVGGDRPLTVEAHLLGWTGDCYGATIGLDLVQRIRDERRFASLPDLRAQIAADVSAIRRTVR
jgi:riboflavin kinase/FMN adenylyltransferase